MPRGLLLLPAYSIRFPSDDLYHGLYFSGTIYLPGLAYSWHHDNIKGHTSAARLCWRRTRISCCPPAQIGTVYVRLFSGTKQWKKRRLCLRAAYHYVLELILKISCQEHQRYLGKKDIRGVSLCEKKWKVYCIQDGVTWFFMECSDGNLKYEDMNWYM